MKFSDIKVGMKVVDSLHPELRGEVTEVLKTRIKVLFYFNEKPTTYDSEHVKFLEPTPSQAWRWT